jgi:hypothetical protein
VVILRCPPRAVSIARVLVVRLCGPILSVIRGHGLLF